MRKKLLYFTQVPWGWIKQRPQFLAEELNKFYDITVVYGYCYKEKKTNEDVSIKLKRLFRFPFDRFSIIAWINRILYKFQFILLEKSFDAIWFTSHNQYKYIKDKVKNKTIIYDCMDDILEFPESQFNRDLLMTSERDLFVDADYVFCSSAFLKKKLTKRYCERPVYVINNAIISSFPHGGIPLTSSLLKFFPIDKLVVTYIGTISEWMDWNLLNKLSKIHNIVINLYGPIAVDVPKIENVNLCGSISHDEVFSVMEASNVLIMPFVVTELIKSVNPVKLYEYIYSGKPCLAPKYGESMPFGEYVYLYTSSEDCSQIIRDIQAGGLFAKRSIEDCKLFAASNSWSQRARRIFEIIND